MEDNMIVISCKCKCYGKGIYRLAVLIFACLCMAAVGEAVQTAYEPFNYAAGIAINGLNGGAGWGGPWTGVGNLTVGPGLTYAGLMPIPAGNALGWTPGAASRRTLAAPVVGAPGITLVMRALIRSNVNGTPATQATLGNSSGGTFIIGDLPQPNPSAGNWGMQNAFGCFYSTHPVVANATTLLVAQIDFNVGGGINERMRLWVNPSPPDMFFITPPDIDVTNANIAQFSGVFWQTQQGQRLDEILINMTGDTCVPPPNTTMVAWYPFDETAGATAANLATGNTGTHIGGPTPVPGMVAGALRFNGTTNYVESPSTIVTNFGPANTSTFCLSGSQGSYSTCLGDFSIDAWVRISNNAPQGVMTILDKRSAVPVLKGYAFFVYQGKLGLQLADGIGAPPFTNFLSPVLTPSIYDGNWHHITVTVCRSGSIRFYYDGAFKSPACVATRPGSLANTSPLRIGTRTAAAPLSGWFKGDIDELEIFNRELTRSEVQNIFMAGPFGKCK